MPATYRGSLPALSARVTAKAAPTRRGAPAVGAWECPPTTTIATTTYPIKWNDTGVVLCMTLDGKTCLSGLTPAQCAQYILNPPPTQPIQGCNATQLRTPSNAFCYRAAQALLPDNFGDCEWAGPHPAVSIPRGARCCATS